MKKTLFNDKFGLTQAVLDGRKTMTRRVISQKIIEKAKQYELEYYSATFDLLEGKELLEQYFFVDKVGKLPYEVCEVVAIAQSYKDAGVEDVIDKDGFTYHAFTLYGYSNKMLVCADLMPHHIRITNVNIERLQDISDEDCLREGIYRLSANSRNGVAYSFVGSSEPTHIGLYKTPRQAFAALIDKVSGKGVWESNPWVFAYEFKLID